METSDGTIVTRHRDWIYPIALAATPLTIAAVRLYIFARGDDQILIALLSRSDLATLWTTLVVPAVPVFSAWLPAFLLLYVGQRGLHKAQRTGNRERFPFVHRRAVTAAAIIFCGILGVLSWWLLTVAALFLTVVVAIYMGQLVKNSWILPRRTFQLAFSILLSLPVVGGTVIGSIGLPVEVVKVNSEPRFSIGYVLAVDDASLMLAYLDGGIRNFATPEIGGRFICPSSSSPAWGPRDYPTLAQILLGYALGAGYVPEECSTTTYRTK